MCIILNQELAVTGLLNAIVEAAVENQDKTNCRIENADITPELVLRYADLLHFADCGPIVKNFDADSLSIYFKQKKSVFEKVSNNKDVYKLCLHTRYAHVLPAPRSHAYCSAFRSLLLKELAPDINYSRRFLKYMRLCD